MNLFSYASLAFSTALTTSNFLLFFSTLSFFDSLSIGEINQSQTKKLINWIQSTIGLGSPMADDKPPKIMGGAKTQNKIEAKLKSAFERKI